MGYPRLAMARDHQLPIRLDNDVDVIIEGLAKEFPRVSRGDIVRSALRFWAKLPAPERAKILTAYVMGSDEPAAKGRAKPAK